jgi:hypothetical protein
MTYQDDPNLNRRPAVRDDRSYTGWIVGALVAVVVIAGIFLLAGHNPRDNTAAITPTAPTTTGSATTTTPATTPPAAPAPRTTTPR